MMCWFEQIHVLGDSRYVMVKYCRLLTCRPAFYVTINICCQPMKAQNLGKCISSDFI